MLVPISLHPELRASISTWLHKQPWPWPCPLGHVAVCVPMWQSVSSGVYTVRLKSRADLLAKTWLFQNILEQTRAAYSFVTERQAGHSLPVRPLAGRGTPYLLPSVCSLYHLLAEEWGLENPDSTHTTRPAPQVYAESASSGWAAPFDTTQHASGLTAQWFWSETSWGSPWHCGSTPKAGKG